MTFSLFFFFKIAATNAGKLVAYQNLPMISYSSPDPVLANKTTYSTLMRFVSPFNKLANAMVVFFKYLKVQFSYY